VRYLERVDILRCDVLKESGKRVNCELMTESGQSVQCEVLRDS